MKRGAGFSIIELMIAITIAAILMVMGAPTLFTTLDNIRLRGKAHNFLAGLQNARAEAVKRNTAVDFVLLAWNVPPTAASLAVAGVGNGQNWMLRTNDQVNFIEGMWGAEGSGATMATAPLVLVGDADNDGAADATTTGTITFTGLGNTTLAAQVQFDFTNPTAGACQPAGPIRCLRVVVSPGGQSRMCDPAAVAPDSRAC